MFQAQNRETINSTWKAAVSSKMIMTTSVTGLYFTTQHKTCKTKTKTDFLVSNRSCPKTDGLRPHHWSGERCELPSGVRGGALTTERFFTIFSTQDGLSLHYNIVLLWITKKRKKFLTHSILSQLLCIWWCCLMFLVHEIIHSRKVASGGLHCREEDRSMG